MTAMDKRRNTFEARWKVRFDRYARTREDDAGIAGWSSTGLAARLRRFRTLLEATPDIGSRVVDVGCGAGTYSRLLAQRGAEVIGVDYSPQTIQKARLRGDEQIGWCVGDARRLPLADGTTDSVLCFGVTQALSDSREAILEFRRVVKEDGYVWVDGLNIWCLPHTVERLVRRLKGQADHLRYESAWQVARTMRRYGLYAVEIYWMPILPRILHWAQPLAETRWIRFVLTAVPPLGAIVSHAFIVVGRKGPA